jgi:predicted nuclease of predicted toxin-antitoxin system
LKLLVDQNLAPKIAGDLADLFPGSMHVASAELGSTADAVIWEYAKAKCPGCLTRLNAPRDLEIWCYGETAC